MHNLSEIENEILSLTAQEREHVALTAWASLENGPALDPEGIEIALRRDSEIESGKVKTISQTEFLKRTNGGK